MNTLALLDTETSSVDPKTGELLEVAIAIWDVPSRSVARVSSWLLEAKANEAEAVNGICLPLVQRHGRQRARVIADVVQFIATSGVIAVVAYNADFDRAWLPELAREKWICAMDDLEWPRPSGNKSLTAVALAHGVGVVHAHRAISDVMTLAALFERVAEVFDARTEGPNGEAGFLDFEAWLALAVRPRAIFEVTEKRFDEARNALAKEAGFRWDAATKSWRRRLAREDAGKLPFDVREVRA